VPDEEKGLHLVQTLGGPGRGKTTSQTAKPFSAKTAKKAPKKAKPAPPRPTPEQERFANLIVPLRVLERGYVRDQLRGRAPPLGAVSVALALNAVRLLRDACPGHGSEIDAALPWLSRRAAREARP
jgi:hypothetical protein